MDERYMIEFTDSNGERRRHDNVILRLKMEDLNRRYRSIQEDQAEAKRQRKNSKRIKTCATT